MNSYQHPKKNLVDYLFTLTKKYDLGHKRLTAVDLSKLITREKKNRRDLIDLCYILFNCEHCIFNDISKESLLQLKKYFRKIENNSVLIVPGESPSRIPTLLQLFFGNGTDYFDLDIDGTKITFVEFPISGLKLDYGNKQRELVEAYVKSKMPFETTSLYILDFHYYNRSYEFFKRLFPNIKKMNEITMPGIIPDAEHYDARCVDAYYVTHDNDSIFDTNYLHCNLTTLFLALRMTLKHEDVKLLNSQYNAKIFAKLFYNFVISDIINASRENYYDITYIDRVGQTRTISEAFLLCRYDWYESLMDQFAIVNIRMLLLIVPRSVLYARISMNRRNSGKRKREENSDYLYFKTLPNVVKVYPFSVLNVISKHRS